MIPPAHGPMGGAVELYDLSTAIIGMSGAGKTVSAKVLVERLLHEQRHTCIIDPTGVWYGLRSDAAGTGPGFGIPIFGGLHGDVAIDAYDGAKVAKLIIDGPISAVVDISELRSGQEQRRFVRDFIATIRSKPRTRFHLVIDEADEFAPQTAADDTGYALLEDMIWIAKRGRVHGFVPMLITQRPADIAKSVLSQMQTLIIHQLVAPTDQAPVRAYLKGHATKELAAQVEQSLAKLKRGQRWVYSPAADVLACNVAPLPETFDTSRTPEAGESPPVPATLATIDTAALVAALKPADTIADKTEEITEKLSGDSVLASRQAADEIASLRVELAQAHEHVAIIIAQRDEYKDRADFYQRQVNAVRSAITINLAELDRKEWAEGLKRVAAQSGEQPQGERHEVTSSAARAPIYSEAPEAAPGKASVISPRANNPRAKPSTAGASPDFQPRHQRILDAMAWASTFLRADNVPRGIVAFLARASSASSSYSNDLSRLRTTGFLDYPGAGLLALTETGRAQAEWPEGETTTAALLAAIGEKLDPRHNRILATIVDAHPQAITRLSLAHFVGASATSSSFANDISKLRTLGLLDYPAPGQVRAADMLFPGE